MKKKIKIRKIKLLRVAHGLTQEDVADVLGVHVSTYSKKESGEAPFNLTEINLLKEFYELSNNEVVETFLEDIQKGRKEN